MDDIDGDGLPDLVVAQTKGTTKLEVLTQVYFATGPFRYSTEPSVTFTTHGAITSPDLLDVDGDGHKDLVLVRIPFGVTQFVNYFVRGKVSIRIDAHLFDNGTFPEKPTFVHKMTLGAPEGREQVSAESGDYNGDGLRDLAIALASDQLGILIGEKGAFLSRKPWVTVDLPAFGVARKCDLDGNERDDIVLFHPAGALSKRIDIIQF